MTVETLTYDSPVDALVAPVRGLVVYEQRYQMGQLSFSLNIRKESWATPRTFSSGLVLTNTMLASSKS